MTLPELQSLTFVELQQEFARLTLMEQREAMEQAVLTRALWEEETDESTVCR